MTNEDDEDKIKEKIALNEKLRSKYERTENDRLSNKVLGVEERILDLQDRLGEVRRKKGKNVNGGT
tara:strand:- start:28 stop:225 length:198 start_codon:yes stop_codon:yes gene_type:complete